MGSLGIVNLGSLQASPSDGTRKLSSTFSGQFASVIWSQLQIEDFMLHLTALQVTKFSPIL